MCIGWAIAQKLPPVVVQPFSSSIIIKPVNITANLIARVDRIEVILHLLCVLGAFPAMP